MGGGGGEVGVGVVWGGRGKQRTTGRPIWTLEQQEQYTNCLELSAALFTLKSFLSSCHNNLKTDSSTTTSARVNKKGSTRPARNAMT